jgi:hypothetical protein
LISCQYSPGKRISTSPSDRAKMRPKRHTLLREPRQEGTSDKPVVADLPMTRLSIKGPDG